MVVVLPEVVQRDSSSGAGFGVSGGMTLDASVTGAGGVTGGIYTEISNAGMSNVPKGRHFYDIELVEATTVSRILEGKFDVRGEVLNEHKDCVWPH